MKTLLNILCLPVALTLVSCGPDGMDGQTLTAPVPAIASAPSNKPSRTNLPSGYGIVCDGQGHFATTHDGFTYDDSVTDSREKAVQCAWDMDELYKQISQRPKPPKINWQVCEPTAR